MIIGCPKPFRDCSIIALLESDFTFAPLHYQIRNGISTTDANAIFLEGTEDYPLDMVDEWKSLNIPILGMVRMSKLRQHQFFTHKGISCPDYYFTKTDQKFALAALLEDVDDETQLIVKSPFGARGLEQFLIKKSALIRSAEGNVAASEVSFQKSKSESKKYRVSLRKEAISTPSTLVDPDEEKAVLGGEKEDCVSFSRDFFNRSPDQWLITKRVFLKNEYRVLMFAQAPELYCERHINLDHFQNNLAVGSKVSYYGAEPEGNISPQVLERIRYYIAILRDAYPLAPALSLDIYVDTEDNVGMFEFAGEFGFRAVNPSDLRKAMITSIKYLVEHDNRNLL